MRRTFGVGFGLHSWVLFRIILLTLLGLNNLAQSSVQTCQRTEVTARLESRLQQHLNEFLERSPDTPGVLVHVEAPRLCLSWSGSAGVDERSRRTVLRPDQTFRIASNTKTYTAAAIMRLVEEDKLNLVDPLDRLLPEEWLEMLRSGGYPVDRMTLRQVLTHTSGLFDHAATREYMRDILGNPFRQWKREDQIRYSVQYGTPHGAPGEVFSYADTGYVILGGLVEKLTGKNMAQSFRELLGFQRLSLAATWLETIEPKPETAGNRAHQYWGDADTYDWNPSMDLYGGGGLVTSTRDLALFVRFLMEGKVYRRKETLTTMVETKIASDQGGYRIGIARITVGDKEGWGHTGFWNTFAYHFPRDGITVAGSVNQQQGVPGRRLGSELFSLVLAAQSSQEQHGEH